MRWGDGEEPDDEVSLALDQEDGRYGVEFTRTGRNGLFVPLTGEGLSFYRRDYVEGESAHRALFAFTAGGKTRGGLYDSDTQYAEDGSRTRERRVLWKFFHSQSAPDSLSYDLFPFISYSGRSDLTKWQFAGGLFGYESSQERRALRLFYFSIPI